MPILAANTTAISTLFQSVRLGCSIHSSWFSIVLPSKRDEYKGTTELRNDRNTKGYLLSTGGEWVSPYTSRVTSRIAVVKETNAITAIILFIVQPSVH